MNEKILVVEDDPDLMHILLHVLKGAGYQVISAYGAEDAIRKLGLHQFDLVLTDLAMPTVSGVEVVQEVKENPETRHIPVIAVTAHVWGTRWRRPPPVPGVMGTFPSPSTIGSSCRRYRSISCRTGHEVTRACSVSCLSCS